MAQSTLPVRAPGVDAAPVFRLPKVGQTGVPVKIDGPFDGDLMTTRVRIGGRPVSVLAESPRECIIQSPSQTPGPSEIEVREGGAGARGDYRNIELTLSSPKTRLQAGELTIVTVKVTGLQGLREDLRLTLQNETPSIASMNEANPQTLIITPSQIRSDGTYVTTRNVTGIRPGQFAISALLPLAGGTGSTAPPSDNPTARRPDTPASGGATPVAHGEQQPPVENPRRTAGTDQKDEPSRADRGGGQSVERTTQSVPSGREGNTPQQGGGSHVPVVVPLVIPSEKPSLPTAPSPTPSTPSEQSRPPVNQVAGNVPPAVPSVVTTAENRSSGPLIARRTPTPTSTPIQGVPMQPIDELPWGLGGLVVFAAGVGLMASRGKPVRHTSQDNDDWFQQAGRIGRDTGADDPVILGWMPGTPLPPGVGGPPDIKKIEEDLRKAAEHVAEAGKNLDKATGEFNKAHEEYYKAQEEYLRAKDWYEYWRDLIDNWTAANAPLSEKYTITERVIQRKKAEDGKGLKPATKDDIVNEKFSTRPMTKGEAQEELAKAKAAMDALFAHMQKLGAAWTAARKDLDKASSDVKYAVAGLDGVRKALAGDDSFERWRRAVHAPPPLPKKPHGQDKAGIPAAPLKGGSTPLAKRPGDAYKKPEVAKPLVAPKEPEIIDIPGGVRLAASRRWSSSTR